MSDQLALEVDRACAVLVVERRGGAVLLGLGRRGGVAAAAHRAPRLAVELVFAAVGAVARDGARVAARLALRDALQRGGGVAVRGSRRALIGGLLSLGGRGADAE